MNVIWSSAGKPRTTGLRPWLSVVRGKEMKEQVMGTFRERHTVGQCLALTVVLIAFCAGCGKTGAGKGAIKIGCAAPLTGDQAQIGIDTCRGVELAVEQANEKGLGLPGVRLEVLDLDDQHNPAQAVNVAKKFVADRDVMAVVGHFNSSCTKPASAVYHEAGITQVTAASTNPELSRQGFKTFFRIAATDDVQGPKGARF